VAFIPIGIGMLYFSSNVMEIEINYTDCTNEVEISQIFFPSSLTVALTELCLSLAFFSLLVSLSICCL
jgi:hypothetical protein